MSYVPNPTGSRSRPAGSAADAGSARSQGRGRGENGAASRGKAATARAGAAKSAPRGRSFEEQRDWKELALLAAGIAAGAAAGAGIAMLFTSQTGPQRRAGLARRARHLGHDAEQRWEDLGFALKEAARSARDRFRHRHAAESETDVDD
jgi:hypothetical protein